ncbi:hypothetical protein [Defluviitalea phaphyphila]|uniref:hypothetical protein n=1 Tax=Defluviitalea phaphyphila TaxID=1473580 RepID=UPI000731651D|nr:hypothetical protein [Defluviitalea phaphyphila]
MKSKELFFNFNLIKENLKRFWPISVIYFLALFAVKPLHILSMFANNELNEEIYHNDYYLTRASYEVESIFILCTSILFAIVLFNYLQSKKSTGMMHALPFTRNQLFNSHILSGMILLIVPLILNTIILYLICTNLEQDILPTWFINFFSIKRIWTDFIFSILSSSIIFLIATFAGMITGTLFIHILCAVVFPFLPITLIGFSTVLLEKFLFGFNSSIYLGNTYLEQNIIPLVYTINSSPLNWKRIIFFLGVCIALYILSYISYKKRNLENASNPIVFNSLKTVFKYGVTFCSMSMVGIYLSELFYKSPYQNLWLYLGMFLGSLIGYVISEMLIEKTIWVFHKLKGYSIYVGIILIIGVILKTDLLGYETRIPDINEIKGVVYDISYNDKDLIIPIDDKDIIKKIQNIHKRIILDKNNIINNQNDVKTHLPITYILNNNKTIKRNYIIPYDYIANDINHQQIIVSSQYKKMYNYNLFRTNYNDIQKIELVSNIVNRNLIITNPEEIKEYLEILKQEILDASYEELTSETDNWGYINIYLKDANSTSTLNIDYENKLIRKSFEKYYTNLENWLIKKNYIQNARILPQDVDKIIIKELKDPINNVYDLLGNIDESLLYVNTWEITDKNKIEEILRSYLNSRRDNKYKYLVEIHVNKFFTIEYGYYTEDSLPDFIK